jgi:hypothetical protein
MNDLHFAIVVGIDEYPAIGHLRAARADAVAFDAWLADPAGGAVPQQNRHLIVRPPAGGAGPLERANARPVQTEVRQALVDIMEEGERLFQRDAEAWENSRLYFYVSGHGMASNFADAALLMANAGRNWWNERVSCTEILSHLIEWQQPFQEIVVFADCCRHRIEGAPPVSLGFDQWRNDRGFIRRAYCFATAFGQAAYEPSRAGDELRGYFTRALLEGLRGEVAPAGQPIHSLNLRDYIERRVPALTRDVRGGPQDPEFYASRVHPLVFVPSSPGRRLWDLRLHRRTFAGPVSLIGGDGAPVAGVPDFDAGPGADWRLRLPQGLYEVRPACGGAPLLRFDFTGAPRQGGEHVEEF